MRPRTRRDQRIYRILIWMGLTIVGVEVGLGLLLDQPGPLMRIRFPEAQACMEQLKAARPPEVIFLGSSHMMVLPRDGLSQCPSLKDRKPIRTCTLAVPAGGLASSAFVADQVFRAGVRPRLVVVEVLPESLNRNSPWIGVDVLRHFSLRDELEYLSELCRTGGLKRLFSTRGIPLYYYRERILQQLGAAVVPSPREEIAESPPTRGAQPAPAAVSAHSEPAPSAVSAKSCYSRKNLGFGLEGYKRSCFKVYAIGGSSAKALHHLLWRCRTEGCQVVLVAPPLSSLHRSLYSPRIEGEYQTYIRNICATYKCRFIDLRDQLPDELFRDHHHIGEWGFRAFTELVDRKVVAPMWQQSAAAAHVATP